MNEKQTETNPEVAVSQAMGSDSLDKGEPEEAQIIAPQGLGLGAVKMALSSAGVSYSVRRTPGGDQATIAAGGVVYEGPDAVEEFLLLRQPE